MDQTGGGELALLSDRVLVNGTVTDVTLTGDGVVRWTEGGSQRCLEVDKEVLGFSTEGPRIKIRAVVEGAKICCPGSRGAPMRKTFVFEPQSEDLLRVWCQKLQDFIDSLGRPKRLFVFVNPFGGKKSASKIFLDDVKPLLEDANVEFTLQETKHQLHAKEVVQTLDLSKYDGIVCVSGDGVLVEVVNGLLEREDWNTAIKIPLGAVPAGTGNGMAKSLLDSVGHPCTAFNAILAIIRGKRCSLDVATISQGETRFFSVLTLAWGLVADIDIESEKYRWMGSARLDFYALQRIFHLRKYNGRISFVPAPGFEDYGEPSSHMGEFMGQEICNPSHDEPMKVQQGSYRGPTVALESLNWRKIDGPFVSVWLHNVTWGGENTKAAPDAKFSDGYLDLILVRNCPRLALLALMTELNNGNHVKSPHVLYFKVKAFVLEPGPRTDDATKEGIIDVDGEVLARGKATYKSDQKALMAYDKLQITVDQGLATVFTPL
ncbi:sphingosine kinase 1-like [Rhododendron vialii]|uniref:sphingosine kinase 1-like n=1 Tax=Rhododendron vialii TaxID=182163 RepID=UPI00265F290F|nr:sphingosine kinase 1-like [Rhododendron vialii]